MQLTSVEEIARAIQALTPDQRSELYARLDGWSDSRIAQDLASGRLDSAIGRALGDEKNLRLRPL